MIHEIPRIKLNVEEKLQEANELSKEWDCVIVLGLGPDGGQVISSLMTNMQRAFLLQLLQSWVNEEFND